MSAPTFDRRTLLASALLGAVVSNGVHPQATGPLSADWREWAADFAQWVKADASDLWALAQRADRAGLRSADIGAVVMATGVQPLTLYFGRWEDGIYTAVTPTRLLHCKREGAADA
jgi:hypothetical protein